MKAQSSTTEDGSPKVGTCELFLGLLVLLVILPGSILSILTTISIFPYDHYPMYSRVHGEDFTYPRVFGLPATAAGSADAAEVDITAQKYWGYQLHIGRRVSALRRIRRQPDAELKTKSAMAFLMDHYNRRQQAGAHDGPPIVRLRTYSQSWKLRSDLSTLHAPYKRTILDESPLVDGE